ncbi:hypothetical protein AVEN_252926-1 [Araneus ventricosus]|uniref:Uncharacterized protein n=1 Tax=Araneus ventricosus TaxID=182803 RepID=A0A4Y2FER1_ARAVE|nr:hypothetical protein AVEN_252926-1 [Araneus ventricosus]
MHAGDYRNTSKPKPEQQFSGKETEFHSNTSRYYLNEDILLKNHDFETKNENPSNTLFQPGKTYLLQNQKKECPVKSNDTSGNEDIQHFENGNAMSLYTARRDNLSNDKRTIQIEPVGRTNSTARPNGISLGSLSAPSILSSASKQHLSGEGSDGNERPKRDFKNERYLIEHQATVFNKVPEKFQPSRKERNQEMKSGQRSKNVNVKKRQDPRKRLKIPIKRLYLTENGKMPSHEKSSLDSVNEMKYIPDRRNSDETDRCSSYSESDLRYIAEQENQINERNMPYPKFQQSLKQSFPKNSVNDNLKYISNVLRCSNYEVPHEESLNENYSKNSDSRFTTDNFLQKELSDFKDFLIYRRNLQNQRVNRGPKIRTIYIPESVQVQEMKELHNRMLKNDRKNEKEYVNEHRSKLRSHLKTKHFHKMRRPKVSDDVLWKQFEQNFRRYATTKRYSGEVIPCKISTEWMSNMGVVGDLLTEKDADTEFKKAAGPKITMNIHEYKEFLITLTIKKKLPFYEIYRRMCGI